MIVIQATCDNHPTSGAAIRSLQRHEISLAIQETIGKPSSVYHGQNNPSPSLPSDFTMPQDVSRKRLCILKEYTYMWALSRIWLLQHEDIPRARTSSGIQDNDCVPTAHRQGFCRFFYDDDSNGEGS